MYSPVCCEARRQAQAISITGRSLARHATAIYPAQNLYNSNLTWSWIQAMGIYTLTSRGGSLNWRLFRSSTSFSAVVI